MWQIDEYNIFIGSFRAKICFVVVCSCGEKASDLDILPKNDFLQFLIWFRLVASSNAISNTIVVTLELVLSVFTSHLLIEYYTKLSS